MIAVAPPDVKQEVVGIDEEVLGAGPLDVVERRDRRQYQRARSDGPAPLTHDDPEAIVLGEISEHRVEARGPPIDLDRERGTRKLKGRVHRIMIPGHAVGSS